MSPRELAELFGKKIDGLLPADRFEQSLAALGALYTLERLGEAVGMVDPATLRTAAQARTQLLAPERFVAGGISLDISDRSV